jgi:hypothetical protein
MGLVSSKWQVLGTRLGIPSDTLEAWDTWKYKHGPKAAAVCCEEVMKVWLTGGSFEYPITWEGLYELLNHTGYCEVAGDLRVAVRSMYNNVV